MSEHCVGRTFGFACVFALVLTGCFEDKPFGNISLSGNTGGTPVNQPPPSGSPAPTPNQSPRISGTPITELRVGEAYAFQPGASDPDGDTLRFSIQNRPAWASFNEQTGRLSGTPTAGDVGQFVDVRITVSDGRGAQASLSAFQIEVTQVALGSVTLSWTPPTTNADGSPMTDLAGYRVYFGRSPGALDEMIIINSTTTTRWVVDNLSSATWYFSMSSYNSSGIESVRSGVVSRTLT